MEAGQNGLGLVAQVLTMVVMIVSSLGVIALLKFALREVAKFYFRSFKAKIVSKLLEDGWVAVGFTNYGYPVTFTKDKSIKIV